MTLTAATTHTTLPYTVSDANAALGAPENVFLTQLPTMYSGCAKNGSPVAYAKTADLSIEGIECLTELDNIEKYAWHAINHKFKSQVARSQTINPDMVRYVRYVTLRPSSLYNTKTLNASCAVL